LLESIIPFLNLLNEYFFSEVSYQTSENQVTIDYAKNAIVEFSSTFFENMENLYGDKIEEIAKSKHHLRTINKISNTYIVQLPKFLIPDENS
jgi:hypothetical protein